MTNTDPLFEIGDKAIVVVGAAGGIGQVVSAALQARGAQLLLADFDRNALAALPPGLAPADRRVGFDLTSAAEVAALMARAREALGRIDGIVNAAGVFRMAPALSLDEDDFRLSLEVNLTGAFLLSREAAKVMHSGGRIVHIATASSHVSNLQYAAYASSKAGLAQLVRVLAREWAADGICVNAIGPAVIETAMTEPILADPDFRQQALAAIPMGRFAKAEDLIGAVLLLLAPGGSFITGQTIYVDGGRTVA